MQALKDHLSPQGTLWVTFVGENSLSTLRRAFIQSDIAIYNGAYSRVIPTISASDGLQLMSHAGIPSPVVNRNSLELKHTSLMDLMIDLRHMFGGNALETRPKHVTSPNFFKKAEAALKGKRDYILTPIDLITLSTY